MDNRGIRTKLLPRQLKTAKVSVSDLQVAVEIYKEIIPEIDTLEVQLEMWASKWDDVKNEDCPSTAMETLDHVDAQFLPSIHALLQILATFPVTTCTAERSFSALKYLKNYLRTTMTEDRLTGLALMYVHRDVPIDIDDIIKRFANDNRRLNFM